MAKKHKGDSQNNENYKTSKTTERQNLENGEIQNVESYRTAKEKTLKLTERRKTKR
jgi:hypothetical protein